MADFWKQLKKPIIGLAPMDGVTDYPARQIQIEVARPDILFTEFVCVEFLSARPEKLKRRIYFGENERPLVAQIFGHTPSAFAGIVEKIAASGFDGLEINMGCPSRNVTKSGGGGALIGNFKLAGEIIRATIAAIESTKKNIPLSVKTRIRESQTATREWFSFLAGFPFSAITIHGRILKQCLSGPVDWPAIEDAAEIVKSKGILYLGNGGITSLTEAKEKCVAHKLDGILIGKAAVGNPWIFKENYKPDIKEILDTVVRHGELAQEFYGERNFSAVFKHFNGYVRGFDGCKQLRMELLKSKNIDEVKKIIHGFVEFEKERSIELAEPGVAAG